MKKISAFLIIMIAMLMAGVCAHAAEFSVDTTSLPMGEALLFMPLANRLKIR